MWNINTLKKKIEDAEKRLVQHETLQKERNIYPLLHAELWALPVEFTCINEVKAIVKSKGITSFTINIYKDNLLYYYNS